MIDIACTIHPKAGRKNTTPLRQTKLFKRLIKHVRLLAALRHVCQVSSELTSQRSRHRQVRQPFASLLNPKRQLVPAQLTLGHGARVVVAVTIYKQFHSLFL